MRHETHLALDKEVGLVAEFGTNCVVSRESLRKRAIKGETNVPDEPELKVLFRGPLEEKEKHIFYAAAIFLAGKKPSARTAATMRKAIEWAVALEVEVKAWRYRLDTAKGPSDESE